METIGKSPNLGIELPKHLTYSEYQPHIRSTSFEKVKTVDVGSIIYFGGTFEKTNTSSTRELKQSLADYSGKTCYSFSASAKIEDVLELIKVEGLKDISIVTYSQGVLRGVELENKLHEEPDINVSGMVLIEPTSFFEREPEELTKTFLGQIKMARDEVKDLPENLKLNSRINDFSEKTRQLIKDGITVGVPKFLKGSLNKEMSAMSQVHAGFEKVEAAVVIIQGKNDKVSDHEKADPKELFIKSRKIYRILPDKFGTHFLPVVRSEQIAKCSLYLLSRSNRIKTNDPTV